MDLTYNLESGDSYQSAMQIRTVKNMVQGESTLMTLRNDTSALKYKASLEVSTGEEKLDKKELDKRKFQIRGVGRLGERTTSWKRERTH